MRSGMTEGKVRAKMTFCLARCPAKAISRFRSSLLTVLPSCRSGRGDVLGSAAYEEATEMPFTAQGGAASNQQVDAENSPLAALQVSILRKAIDGLDESRREGVRLDT